jgi:predicted PolB exonuclease-like 3'-5' exonuclease
MRPLHRELTDERSLIAAFFELFDASATSPRLVSWNGNGFDIPVLRYRAVKHGLPAPAFYRVDEGQPSYTSRYHDRHVDLMDVLSGYGASSRAGLGMVCELLELPGKTFLDREVYEHFYAGEHVRIAEYCKLDTLETLLVFLAWCVHTGTLPPATLAAYMTTIRAMVARETYGAWNSIAERLANWPPWLPAVTA